MSDGWHNSVNREAPSIQCLRPLSEETTERTPLLEVKRTNVVTTLWVSFLSIFLIVGVFVGGYLLIEEDEWTATDDLIVISRNTWQAIYHNKSIPELKHPIRRVRLVQTNTSACATEEECSKLVLNLQVEHIHVLKQPDIMYNFLITSNGVVYEGRGWNYMCDYDDTLTVAVFGASQSDILGAEQEDALRNLIELAISKKLLIPCYDILVKYDPQLSGISHFIDSAFAMQQMNNKLRNCL